MNKELIKRWNFIVEPDDTVIHCGDFFMGPSYTIDEILPRLNGHIILVRGNHDSPQRIERMKKYGVEVKDIYYLPYKGRFFVFCHFPIASEEFKRMVREDNGEVIIVYGHLHDNAPSGLIDGTFHAGVDTNNLTPVRLDYIWRLSRDWEDTRNIPPIMDPLCQNCYYLINNKCKGQDGGCIEFVSNNLDKELLK